VSNNVSPEEVEALLDEEPAAPVGAVTPRDFSQPRRLSLAQQQAIGQAVKQCLPQFEAKLGAWLRAEVVVEVAALGEAASTGLFDGLEDPLLVLTFAAGGGQGWIVWENGPALRAALTSLGEELEEDPEERLLTPLEAGVTEDVLGVFTQQLGEVLNLAIRPGQLSQSVRALASLLDTDGDPQRLFVHFDVTIAGSQSTIRVYLPGILPEAKAPDAAPTSQLPIHLDEVPVTLSAELGSIEISLDDLMKIEEGDVIPLGIPVGDPLDIIIEGNRAGKAHWGNHHGNLALRVEHIESKRERPRHD